MDQLDELINQIASVLGISREEVFDKFSKEDLDSLLKESQCEPSDNTIPLFNGSADSDDIPCEDLGAPLNPDDGVNINDLINNINKKNKEPEIDVQKCIDSVKDLNKEIEKDLELLTKYRILLDKLVELNDNLIGIQYYYDERIKRVGIVLNDFKSVLEKIKSLESDKSTNEKKIKKVEQKIKSTTKNIFGGSASELNELKKELTTLTSNKKTIESELKENRSIVTNRSIKYPKIFTVKSLKEKNSSISFNNLISNTIDEDDIKKIDKELGNYSEFLKAKSISSNASSSNILSRPLIEFSVEFQNLDLIEITKTEVDKDTGKQREVKENILIKSNPLLNDRSFFNDVPGYKIKGVKAKKEPKGALYKDYYNKLNDPINNFFSLDERGLTESANLVDPNLKGTDAITKKENGTEYYIRDLKKLEQFYENFETLFKQRREKVKSKVIADNTKVLKNAMETLARIEVDALLAIGGVNIYLPEDNKNLDTIVNNIKNANTVFAKVIKNLNSEISRIEDEIERLTPKTSNIKAKLKEKNPKCFKDIDKEEEDENSSGCKDLKKVLGSDVFFESIGKGSNGALPNCTQLCYWRQFAKVVNKMGLFPIPNDPRTLRYWPVGLVLYVPAEIKIPLPIIWIPVLTISSPVGIHVLFITVNGLFISPVMFFFSSSGLKQHVITLRGSSDKFGFDRFDETVKDTIKIPLKLASIGNPDLKTTAEVLDTSEDLSDIIKDAKKSISKRIDDLGNPVLKNVNKVKEKIESTRAELRKEYYTSVENGDIKKAEELKEKIAADQIEFDTKVDALSEDIINYFDRIDMPTVVLPKEKGKVNPNLSGVDSTITGVVESASNKLSILIPDSKTSVVDNISLSIAKYKDEIEKEMTQSSINLEKDIGLAKDTMSKMVKKTFDKALGKGPAAPSTEEAISQLNEAKNSKDSKKLKNKIKDISDKLDSSLVKQTLSITPSVISKLSAISVTFDAFASCCSKKEPFSLSAHTVNPIIEQVFNQAISLVNDEIKSLSDTEFKSLFGGKPNITAKDLRLGMLSVTRSAIPKSLSFPKPDINIESFSAMFSGLLGSMQLPQAPFPAAIKALTMPAQINVNLNIIKSPLKNLLSSSIKDNLTTAFPQDLDEYFYSINPKDIKRYLKDFINQNIDSVEDKIKPFYTLVNIAKSSKGLDLSVIEKSLFNIPPYGPGLSALFISKGLLKMKLPSSSVYFTINLEALKKAIGLLKPSLNPIVSTPIVYPLVAGAAVIGQLDNIRKIHPILNEDDIPPWERLSAKNILFLAFVDQFITTAADNIGFYRSYL